MTSTTPIDNLMETLATAANLASLVKSQATAKNESEVVSESVLDVLMERERQVAKGFTPEHDDQRADGSLVSFAASILGTVVRSDVHQWVWNAFTRLRNKQLPERRRLVIAVAVLLAEIERRDRITLALPCADELEIISPAVGSTS